MATYYDEQLGRWVSDEEEQEQQVEKRPLTAYERSQMSFSELQAANPPSTVEQDELFKPEAPKPFVAQGPGQALGEVFNLTANAGTALVTDYADLASYVGDTLTQTGNVLQGKRFEQENFLNDADNPWTQWRLNQFEPETELGMAARPIIRGAVALLTLPKVAVSGLLAPLKLASKAPVVGGAASKGIKGVKAADAAIKGLGASDDVARVTKSLQALKAPANARLVGGAAKTPWLYSTYDDVGRAIAAGEPLTGVKAMMDSTRQSVKALTNLNKLPTKLKIKTVGEALAWDAFVAFNMSGEGDLTYDEGLSNWLVDSGMPWATAIGSPLATSADDAAIARKFKLAAEGTMFAGLLNGVFDMWRVSRFASKFRAADGDTKAAILNRLSGQAQDIGDGLGSTVGEFSGVRLGLEDLKQGEEAAEAFAKNQARKQALKDQFTTERARKQASTATNRSVAAQQAPLANRQPGVQEVDVQEVADDPSLVRTGVDETVSEVDVQELTPEALPGTPPDTKLLPNIDPTIEEASVTVPPMVEPVITPQTIRSGFRESLLQKFRDQPIDLIENSNGDFVQLKDLTKSLMPTTRTGMLQYMLDNPPRVNALGLEDGVDALWRNFLTDRGLQEGWATIDPDTMQVKWNRSVARDLDSTDLDLKQAEAVDDAVAYEQWQSNRGRTSDNPPNDEVQQRLGEMDAAEGKIADEVKEAASDTAAYNASEVRRIEEAATARSTDPDYQLVDDMLGRNLDDTPEPEIVKATTGRGWEVYDADGELLGRTQTKRAAAKLAERQKKADRKALINKAKQAAEDGGDQTINTSALDDGTTDAVSGKVKLTGKQAEELLKYPGMKRFIDEFSGGKKTYEFTNAELSTYVDGFKAMLQAGVDGPRARVLKNLIDKFDTALKLMEPDVRAIRRDMRLAEDVESLVTKGEVCNFLDL